MIRWRAVTLLMAVLLTTNAIIDTARAEIWFEDFTDGDLTSAGVEWDFSQGHSISPTGLVIDTADTSAANAIADITPYREGWSIRTRGRLLQESGFFGVGVVPLDVSTGSVWNAIDYLGNAGLGNTGTDQVSDFVSTDLDPFNEDVTVQLDTLDGVMRMWAWRDDEQPQEDIAPLIEEPFDLRTGAPGVWGRTNEGPSAISFSWAAFSTEHLPVHMDVRSLAPDVEEIKIVVPNNLTSVDGSSTSGDWNENVRTQVLIPASQFGDLPPGKHLITQMANRPDASVNSPITASVADLQIRLSTTNVESLSTTYADNTGKDETLVYSGSATASTLGEPAGVKDFDYVTDLQQPFFYDPTEGDLLVDLLIPEPYTSPLHMDQVSSSVMQRVASFGDVTGDVAQFEVHDVNIPVMQFTFLARETSELELQILQAGDADQDLDFDQLDLVRVQVASRYLTGQVASWGQGDWNGAPGGSPGNPPRGDGLFNQLDIVAAQQGAAYLTGPYAAVRSDGARGDGQTSLVYDANTGELAVDAPAGAELTSINVTSASAVFIGSKPVALDGAFDNFAADNVFKATFGGSFGTISFGSILPAGMSEDALAADLSAVGSLDGGGDLGQVDLVYVPEPASALLLTIGLLIWCLQIKRSSR